MKKISFFLCGLNLLLSTCIYGQSSSPSSPSVATQKSNSIHWHTDYGQAVEAAKSSSKPIFILFTGTNWCPACGLLERNVLSHPQFNKDISDKFVFLKAEFPDNSERGFSTSPYRSLKDRYGIQAYPTMIVVDVHGNRLFVVDYQNAGPEKYMQDIMYKLGKIRPNPEPSSNQQKVVVPPTNVKKDDMMTQDGYYIPSKTN